MDTAIIVLAHNRPRYLHVTLDGVFHADGVERYPVYVCCDGGGSSVGELMEVTQRFPVSGWLLRNRRLDCLLSYTHSIQAILDYGYDAVLYLTDDLLIRPDTLLYLDSIPKDAFFHTLVGRGGLSIMEGVYSSFGNLVLSRSFPSLFKWVSSGQHLGKQKIRKGKEIEQLLTEQSGEDAVYNRFSWEFKKKLRSPPIAYAFHFGLRGRNKRENTMSPAALELERSIFQGEPASWLERVMPLPQRKFSDPVITERLWPRNFKYYDS